MPAFRRIAVRATRVLFVAVEERSNSLARCQFFDGWRVTLDFGVSRTRSQTELFSENIEDTSKTDKRGVFGHSPGRERAEIKVTFCWHDNLRVGGFPLMYQSKPTLARDLDRYGQLPDQVQLPDRQHRIRIL